MYVFDILSIPYPFPLFFFFCHVSFLLYLFLSFPLFFCLSFICVLFFRYVCLPVNILLLCCKLGIWSSSSKRRCRPAQIYFWMSQKTKTVGHTLTNRKSNMAMPGYTDPNSRTSRLSSAFPWGRGFTSVAGSGCAVSASLIYGFHSRPAASSCLDFYFFIVDVNLGGRSWRQQPSRVTCPQSYCSFPDLYDHGNKTDINNKIPGVVTLARQSHHPPSSCNASCCSHRVETSEWVVTGVGVRFVFYAKVSS